MTWLAADAAARDRLVETLTTPPQVAEELSRLRREVERLRAEAERWREAVMWTEQRPGGPFWHNDGGTP